MTRPFAHPGADCFATALPTAAPVDGAGTPKQRRFGVDVTAACREFIPDDVKRIIACMQRNVRTLGQPCQTQFG